MSYATVADVQARLDPASGIGFTISATSRPSTDQVQSFIDQVAGELDSALRKQDYTTPATGTSDVLMLGRYNAEKAAAMAWHAHGGNFDDSPAKVKRWEKDYEDFLNRLRQGQQGLIDQDPGGDDQPFFGVVGPVSRDDYFS
ncbi:MAG TPA: hypothetical protein PKD09_17950 [Aggregatilinea sp.]|uniref:hypothetical protein n=1 Tax=Aggregatilinea sp. TaxID=2806333 RepID=UPI002CB2D6C6|nr:hypothetical protein [Aggregatilinea sp.]HML23545.1 hypothetical protein [Aggregatilinea sp.]